MKGLSQWKNGLDEVWNSLNEGWRRVRESAEGALTRFRPLSQEDRHPPASPTESDFAAPTAAPVWALLSGEVFEDDREVVVRLEVPGLHKGDFDIQVDGRWLTVRGEKQFRHENRQGHYHLLQCAYGSFERRLALPADVQANKAEANYRDGVLRIVLPKAENARKVRQIEVK